MKDSLLYVTGAVLLGIIFLIATVLVLERVDRFLLQQAINDCAKSSRYEYTNEDNTVKAISPLSENYRQCLKDKKISP